MHNKIFYSSFNHGIHERKEFLGGDSTCIKRLKDLYDTVGPLLSTFIACYAV